MTVSVSEEFKRDTKKTMTELDKKLLIETLFEKKMVVGLTRY